MFCRTAPVKHLVGTDATDGSCFILGRYNGLGVHLVPVAVWFVCPVKYVPVSFWVKVS